LNSFLDLVPQRAGSARRRPGGGSFDRGQQREVALAPQRPEDTSPSDGARICELLEERRQSLAVGRIQAPCFLAQVRDEDVEVTRRAQLPAEPGELAPHLGHPGRVEDRCGGIQHRAQPARCDAHLMKVLGILPDPNARIVGEHPCVLLPEVRTQLLERSRRQRQLGLRHADQSLLQGPGAVRGLGAGLAKSRLEPGQLLPGRGQPLELDLAERAGRPLPVEERDRGDADLRERPASSLDAQPGRMRPRAQHRSELEARGRTFDPMGVGVTRSINVVATSAERERAVEARLALHVTDAGP
jgi:hypothetical protein